MIEPSLNGQVWETAMDYHNVESIKSECSMKINKIMRGLKLQITKFIKWCDEP